MSGIHGYLDTGGGGGKARWPAIHGWSMDGIVTMVLGPWSLVISHCSLVIGSWSLGHGH